MKEIKSFIFILVIFKSFFVFSQTQQNYFIIKSGETKTGFAIQRYEFDKTKKQWIAHFYTQTNSLTGNVSETLVAIADSKLNPLSYRYNGFSNGHTKTLQATFKKNQMILFTKEDGKKKRTKKNLPLGTFLSSFLPYMMTQNGLKINLRYSFNIINEEDGSVSSGTSYIKEIITYKKRKLFHTQFDIKQNPSIAYLASNGEAFFIQSPIQKINLEKVTSFHEAAHGFTYNKNSLSAFSL